MLICGGGKPLLSVITISWILYELRIKAGPNQMLALPNFS